MGSSWRRWRGDTEPGAHSHKKKKKKTHKRHRGPGGRKRRDSVVMAALMATPRRMLPDKPNGGPWNPTRGSPTTSLPWQGVEVGEWDRLSTWQPAGHQLGRWHDVYPLIFHVTSIIQEREIYVPGKAKHFFSQLFTLKKVCPGRYGHWNGTFSSFLYFCSAKKARQAVLITGFGYDRQPTCE